jgi:hypothetical protein
MYEKSLDSPSEVLTRNSNLITTKLDKYRVRKNQGTEDTPFLNMNILKNVVF